MVISHNGSKSINGQLNMSMFDIKVNQTYDELQHLNIYEKLDLNEVYKEESEGCNKYRLVVTIRPYCTNVLFNPLTEIVRYEADGVKVVTDDVLENLPKEINREVYGKRIDLDRGYMLENTEYTSEPLGYKYYIGYDFLNNHILRNNTYKSVTVPKSRINENIFNTIEDIMRDQNGEEVLFTNRFNVNDVQIDIPKKLYDSDDLIEFSTNEVHDKLISVDNGWYGIVNKGHVPHKAVESGVSFYKPLNNYENCTFVDFHPGRNYFSFSPILNKNKNRFEENWKIMLTYPSREDYENKVIFKNGLNSLPVTSVLLDRTDNGQLLLYITTSIKNNIKRGDLFDLYLLDNGGYSLLGENITSSSDSSDNNTFSCSDLDFTYKFLKNKHKDKITYDEIKHYNDLLLHLEFRIVRKVNPQKSVRYYAQMLKPIPNFEYKRGDFYGGDLNEYIKNNCVDENDNIHDFNRSVYDLAYSKTIYNDPITQCTYTDDIDLSYLCEGSFDSIYVTFIKNNEGYKEWYYEHDYNNEKIERSRLFGCITDCLYSDTDIDEIKKLPQNYDYRLVNNLGLYNSEGISKDEVKFDRKLDSEYIHSICEIDETTQNVETLSEIMYRFNTVQRELGDRRHLEGKYVNCVFKDIVRDDKDFNGFTLSTENLGMKRYKVDGKEISFLDRPEGYYYNPHYRIQLKKRIKNCGKYSAREIEFVNFEKNGNGIINVRSKLYYKLLKGDFIEVKTKEGVSQICQIKEVKNRVDITIQVNDVIQKLFDENSKIYTYPFDLPKYARKIDEYTYTYPIFENFDSSNIVYKNKRKYINFDINFFLKRQDPEGYNGLYIKQDFGDIEGYPFDRFNVLNNSFELPPSNCGIEGEMMIENIKTGAKNLFKKIKV